MNRDLKQLPDQVCKPVSDVTQRTDCERVMI